MNPVIEKIRALRELARGTTNEHEAQAAARQAGRLAEKHRIAEAEIEAAADEGARAPAVIDREHPAYRGGAIAGWKQAIVHTIAAHFSCAIVRSRVPRGAHVEQQLLLVGQVGDIELARETIGWLSLQIAMLCNAVAAGRGRAYRAAWSVGCVRGIYDQLKAGQWEARAEADMQARAASSKALVRLDARLAEAKQTISHLKNHSIRPTVSDAGAYARGRQHGQRIPVTAATTEKRPVRALAGGA